MKIKDIAELAGVSPASVSFVLNDKWSKKVTPENARRIMDLVKKHDYKRNTMAIGLHLKKYFKVAFIVQKPEGHASMIGSLSMQYSMSVISEYLYNYGYSLELIQTSPEEIRRANGYPRENDAIIFMAWNASTLKQLLEEIPVNKPYVFIGGNLDNPKLSYIFRNTSELCYQATRHFLMSGHRRIGLVKVHEERFMEKLEGYKRALKEFNVPFEQELVYVSDKVSIKKGFEATKTLMAGKNPPTAFLCDDNLDALGVVWYLNIAGVKIPEQVEIISYGDKDIADMSILPLSYIKIPSLESALYAVESILKMIKNDKITLLQRQIPEELIYQGTTRNSVI